MSTYPPATKKPKLVDTRPLDVVLGQKGACMAVANSPDSPLSALDRGVSALVAHMFHHGARRSWGTNATSMRRSRGVVSRWRTSAHTSTRAGRTRSRRRWSMVTNDDEGPALPPVPLFRCFGEFSFSHAPVSRLGPPSSGFESETLPCKKNNLEKQKVYRTTERGNGVGLF